MIPAHLPFTAKDRQKAQLLSSQRRHGYLRQRARPGTLGGRHVPPLSTLEVARTGLPSWSGPGSRRPEPARGSAKRLLGLSLCPSSSPGCEPLHRPGGSSGHPCREAEAWCSLLPHDGVRTWRQGGGAAALFAPAGARGGFRGSTQNAEHGFRGEWPPPAGDTCGSVCGVGRAPPQALWRPRRCAPSPPAVGPGEPCSGECFAWLGCGVSSRFLSSGRRRWSWFYGLQVAPGPLLGRCRVLGFTL